MSIDLHLFFTCMIFKQRALGSLHAAPCGEPVTPIAAFVDACARSRRSSSPGQRARIPRGGQGGLDQVERRARELPAASSRPRLESDRRASITKLGCTDVVAFFGHSTWSLPTANAAMASFTSKPGRCGCWRSSSAASSASARAMSVSPMARGADGHSRAACERPRAIRGDRHFPVAIDRAFRHIPPVRGTEVPPGAGGRSSGVEHNLAKVGVVGSNPIARSNFSHCKRWFKTLSYRGFSRFSSG